MPTTPSRSPQTARTAPLDVPSRVRELLRNKPELTPLALHNQQQVNHVQQQISQALVAIQNLTRTVEILSHNMKDHPGRPPVASRAWSKECTELVTVFQVRAVSRVYTLMC